MSSNWWDTAIKENQLLTHVTPDINLTCFMAVKEARLKRVQNIWFYLYDILENAKLWGQKTDRSTPRAAEISLSLSGTPGNMNDVTTTRGSLCFQRPGKKSSFRTLSIWGVRAETHLPHCWGSPRPGRKYQNCSDLPRPHNSESQGALPDTILAVTLAPCQECEGWHKITCILNATCKLLQDVSLNHRHRLLPTT